jgi:hypothetical protein
MLKPNERLMRDNPLSKIPTLVLEDGFTLFDSVVICEYLNDLGAGSLFPRQGADKWQALRWHALGDGLLDRAFGTSVQRARRVVGATAPRAKQAIARTMEPVKRFIAPPQPARPKLPDPVLTEPDVKVSWTDSAGIVSPVSDRSAFELTRGRAIFSGFAFSPRLTYNLTFDYTTTSDSAAS